MRPHPLEPDRTLPRLALGVLLAALAASVGGVQVAEADAPVEGAAPAVLVVVDAADGSTLVRTGEAAAQRQPPCSTFKIVNALIALRAGAVPAGDGLLRRDRRRDPAGKDWPASWDRDHDLESAIRNSVLWYFQELARRVGLETYRRTLAEIGYGNGDLSGGVDRFWLSSSLEISADEQAHLLARLVRGELPFEADHVERVRRALLLDSGSVDGTPWAWYGKTGTCRPGDGSEDRWLGWLVGWVEGPRGTHAYAFLGGGDDFRRLYRERPGRVREALAEHGLLPAEPGPPRRDR